MRCSVGAGREILSIITGLRRVIVSGQPCIGFRQISTSRAPSPAPLSSNKISSKTLTIGGITYGTDSWYNVSPNIIATVGRNLHLKIDHPISITRQLIESKFPSPTYKYHNDICPVVSTHQNFDSLGFPIDHPGRSRTDTYYLNKDTVLRTHTSAHQADTFRANESEGYLISADVYRRDAVDRSHYPVFHQMEGARMWNRSKPNMVNVAEAILQDFARLPTHDMKVEDPNPPVHAERNPLQVRYHATNEVEAIAAHLKRSLELVVVEIFSRARETAVCGSAQDIAEPLRVRWVEAYFPFTSPSWEMEIYWQGHWLEVLGCGVVKQEICINADVPHQLGWAFGLGLERLAMLLFDIPDIRLFWTDDKRFLGQFKGLSQDLTGIKKFVPYSKHPACYKDIAFWLQSTSPAAGLQTDPIFFHENDFMEIVRDIGRDHVEDVKMVDEFTHPVTGRKSRCYRIGYRSLKTTLRNEEANAYHKLLGEALVDRLDIELRWYAAEPELGTSVGAAEITHQRQTKTLQEEDRSIVKELETQNREILSLKDKYLRSVADFRNLQERTRREVQSARDFAIQKFAKDLMESVDNLDRALSMVPEEKLVITEKDEHIKDLVNLYDGLKMTETILMQTFKKHGLERFDPSIEGEKFNPNEHDATFMMPVVGKEDGTVINTQVKGFKLNNRVIRAAKVGVVKN